MVTYDEGLKPVKAVLIGRVDEPIPTAPAELQTAKVVQVSTRTQAEVLNPVRGCE